MSTAALTSATSDLTISNFDPPDDSTVDRSLPSFGPSAAVVSLGYAPNGLSFIARVLLPERTSYDAATQPRIREFVHTINRLLSARINDDAASTPVVDGLIAKRVVEYFVGLCMTSGAMPSLYPLADRGLLLRWTRDNDSLDIEFDAEGDVVALLKSGGQRQAGFLHSMWRDITRWLFEVSAAA